jgi:hypothetical protein
MTDRKKGKDYNSMTLAELLSEVNGMFHPNIDKKNLQKITCHSFDLYNHNGYWGFNVIDSWHNWLRKDLKYQFGLYEEPRYAVLAFIKYVQDGKIKVKKLMEV